MLKRILISCGIFFCALPPTFAAQVYLSPALSYISNKTDTVTFQGYVPKFIIGVDNDAMGCNGNGYGNGTPSFYLAAEIFTQPFGPIITIHDTDTSGLGNSLKPRWSWGLDLLPGINLDNVLKVYARLGWIRTKFSTPRAVRNGYQLGIGGEYKLTTHWAIRLDYIHTSYRSAPGLSSPRMDEGMLSVLYRLV